MRIRNVIAVLVLLSVSAVAQTPDTFTYQGRLDFQGRAYDGSADFRFTLWDSAAQGEQVGSAAPRSGIEVVDGLFSVSLDFTSAGLDQSRWLQIEVRTPAWNGAGAEPPFTTLATRQPVTASPYSLHTRGISVGANGRDIGIGTTVPLVPLHVAPREGIAIGQDTAQGGFTGLTLDLTSESNGAARIQAVRTSGLLFGDLYLNPFGGNVGIGTSTPSHRLTVNGSLRLVSGGLQFPDDSVQSLAVDIDIAVVNIPTGSPLRLPPNSFAAREFAIPAARGTDAILVENDDRNVLVFVQKAFCDRDGFVTIVWANRSGGEDIVAGNFRVVMFH